MTIDYRHQKLSLLQRAYIAAILSGENPVTAVTEAGASPKNAKLRVVKFRKSDKLSRLISEAKEEKRKAEEELSYATIVRQSKELYTLAMERNDTKEARNITELQAKLGGFLSQKSPAANKIPTPSKTNITLTVQLERARARLVGADTDGENIIDVTATDRENPKKSLKVPDSTKPTAGPLPPDTGGQGGK